MQLAMRFPPAVRGAKAVQPLPPILVELQLSVKKLPANTLPLDGLPCKQPTGLRARGARLFELESEHHWPIERSPDTDVQGFKSYRIV
jgi:hypothetical protein